jgi:hypothetical protein
MMKDTVKWRILFGGFFDAMDILLLAMCLQAIMADLRLTPAAAGMLATSTMVGVALSAVIIGWVSDTYGRRVALQISLGYISETWPIHQRGRGFRLEFLSARRCTGRLFRRSRYSRLRMARGVPDCRTGPGGRDLTAADPLSSCSQ